MVDMEIKLNWNDINWSQLPSIMYFVQMNFQYWEIVIMIILVHFQLTK